MSFMSVIWAFSGQAFTKVGRGREGGSNMPSYAFSDSFAVWPKAKILGILWNYVKDEMYFNFTDLIEHGSLLDKLKMLSILHLLYDPLGVLFPYTITGKFIMQLCWKLGLT
jgi:hypothetical protein